MAWEKHFVNFNLVKVDGNTVRVHQNRYTYLPLYIGEEVSYALWSGDILNVYLKNGKVRQYISRGTYREI